MANWERREADTLAEAIDKHLKRNPDLVHENAQLAVVQRAVDEAANTVATTATDLQRHRSQVCAICRGSDLSDCDVHQGWSDNCAFIRANTEYGAL
jgi:hypothetical protein